jgi:hypothetical protein
MQARHFLPIGCLTLAALLGTLSAQPSEPAKGKAAHPWTLEEAAKQLAIYPNDAYLQYVAMQLERRENREGELSGLIDGPNRRQISQQRAEGVDLFNLFSGSLAIQESLQRDTMIGDGTQRSPAPVRPMVKGQVNPKGAERQLQEDEDKRRQQRVPVSSLTGPTVKSHPWGQMLAGKQPNISSLARSVPEDYYFVEFRSLNKLLDTLDVSDLWSKYLFNQAAQEARSQRVGDRLKKQLVIETNALLRPVYDLVVDSVAVTGSDLFVAEGSDVTMLFHIKQEDVFKARMDGFLAGAEKARPDVKRIRGEFQGIPFVHLETPDREIHVFSAYPSPDMHVRSNSRTAFERVLMAIRGQGEVHRLGDTKEFAYIRTLMPQGAPEEDGFVYLSDPFIRRLVGPQVKLTERHRLLCHNHLSMIGHASLLYQTQNGAKPTSLEMLAQAQCAPGIFGEGKLACPDGGHYSLAADGMTGICSKHGQVRSLIPCCEIPLDAVDGMEADAYKAFLTEYNQYWRMYFDPIAVRIQINHERYRLETIILPLIDNSIYTGVANVLGGRPEPLDALPVPRRNIFSVAVRLDKEKLLRQAGLWDETAPGAAAKRGTKQLSPENVRSANNLRQIALALHNYNDTYGKLPAVASFDKESKPLLSWRVHILPFIEQQTLYQEFHLDEPWDSEHNKKLIPRMPSVYSCQDAKLSGPGKTTYLAPVGKGNMFTGDATQLRFGDVPDGTSNTILLLQANADQAVTWTKPADFAPDLDKPLDILFVGQRDLGFNAAFADGSVHFLLDTIDRKTLRALFTRAGGEVVNLTARDERPDSSQTSVSRGPFYLPMEQLEQLKVKEFLTRGIGNQIGLHSYDGVPLLDVNLPRLLGMLFGTFGGRPGLGGPMEWEVLMIGFVGASLNTPAYVSIPVVDAKIVDDFLDRLDAFLPALARRQDRGGFFGLEQDFYHFPLDKKAFRTLTIQFGPIKWRIFWARIGNGLYIASKPFILEDLATANQSESGKPAADHGSVAHGMVRIRAEHWDQVLPDYRLGWAENNRQACLNNIGPLSSMARAVTAKRSSEGETEMTHLLDEITQSLGYHCFCPEAGHYVVSADGTSVTCSIHGSAQSPRQPAEPSEKSTPNKLLKDFKGMTVSLTFLSDGLHAIVEIKR